MKRIYKYLTGLLLLPLLLASCAGDKMRPINEDEAGMPGLVRFTLSNNLRATGDPNATRPVPALDREKAISKLYAVVYNKDSRSHYKTVECTSPNRNNTYEFDNKKGGDFFFFLIANPDTELEKKLKQNPATPEALGQLIATQSPGEDNTATNFLMTSQEVNVKVNTASSTTIANKIALVRVAARFDFYNKIEGLKITKITFGKRYTSTHLFPQVGKMSALTSTTNKVYDGSLFENEALKATIYGYETDTPDETFFTLEGSYKGDVLTPETIKLDNFVIKRNHLYNIILCEVGGGVDPDDPSKPFGKLKYEIKVADWEEGETLTFTEEKSLFVSYDVEIEDASFLTPSLKNSPSEVYTTHNKKTEVTIKLQTYVGEGVLSIVNRNDNRGVTLQRFHTITDPVTGLITQSYRLTLPERAPIPMVDKDNNPILPKDWKYTTVSLEAINATGETHKRFTIKHGRIELPVEAMVYASFVDPQASLQRHGRPIRGGGIGGGKLPIDPLNPYPINPGIPGKPDPADNPNWASVYLTHEEAVKRYGNCKFDGVEYHMPYNQLDLNSIIIGAVHYMEGNRRGIIGRKESAVLQIGEEDYTDAVVFPSMYGNNQMGYRSTELVSKSDYYNNCETGISYALRFKKDFTNLSENKTFDYGKHLQMAYRYEWKGDFAIQHGNTRKDIHPSSILLVQCRYLGPNWNGTMEDIINEEFWKNDEIPECRFFMTGIYYIEPNYIEAANSMTHIMIQDSHIVGHINSEKAQTDFDPSDFNDYPYVGKNIGFPVVLFRSHNLHRMVQ